MKKGENIAICQAKTKPQLDTGNIGIGILVKSWSYLLEIIQHFTTVGKACAMRRKLQCKKILNLDLHIWLLATGYLAPLVHHTLLTNGWWSLIRAAASQCFLTKGWWRVILWLHKSNKIPAQNIICKSSKLKVKVWQEVHICTIFKPRPNQVFRYGSRESNIFAALWI